VRSAISVVALLSIGETDETFCQRVIGKNEEWVGYRHLL